MDIYNFGTKKASYGWYTQNECESWKKRTNFWYERANMGCFAWDY